MAYSIAIADSAKTEYREALTYIAKTLASPQAMKSLTDAYEAALYTLRAFPKAYRVDAYAKRETGQPIRKVNVRNYGLFYLVNDSDRQVRILSFLHNSRDAIFRLTQDLDALN